ncbi:isoniazid response ATPase/transcriptional regulator IniR [soil metagenome]
MRTSNTSGAATTVRERFIGERQARLHAIVAAGSREARRVVVGNAGSGKTTLLRELRRQFTDSGIETVTLNDSLELEIADIPSSQVLIVDDLHILGDAQLSRVSERADNPTAAMIVATRPWPRSEALSAILRTLERGRPAIVLGHVSRSDVLTYLEESDQAIPVACVDHIVEVTGGVSWLVSEALSLHDERDCVNDPAHTAVLRAVEDRIAYRLDTIEPFLRAQIEALCAAPPNQIGLTAEPEDIISEGYAEGLLMRNGEPVPLVRSAVRATLPAARFVDLGEGAAAGLARSAASGDASYRDWIGGIPDPGLAHALVEQADRVLDRDPARAAELYSGAIECGGDPAEIAGRRAQAALATGDTDTAGAILDEVSLLDGVRDSDRIADASATLWSARGMMGMSDAVYRSLPPVGAESCARATIVGIGVGDAAVPGAPQAGLGLPSTLSVAMALVDRGLRSSLQSDGAEAAVADLVRASEMYTASASSAPIPVLPAVIATLVAINVADLDVAHRTIEDAIAGNQGGNSARSTLLLWRSWLAVQRARPADARQALAESLELAPVPSARDAVLANAIHVAIARRYEDAAALEATWSAARDSVLRTEADLYTLLPLAELVAAAARMDDTARLMPHFTRALEIVELLGSPHIWAAHLHWSGIQQGILLNRPDDLKPHARSLVAAAPHSPVAAVMAQAGRVWTATLAGSVDADAVEAAAHGLASAGLGWDGARLAGHGASRSTDRKVSARLLSCARDLHPHDGVRPSSRAGAEPSSEGREESGGIVLSERERDVAHLVLQGKTYAEIGQTIFISPRTAEHHIAHIRRRLGATSRSDLIAKLRVVVGQSTPPNPSTSLDEGALS